MGGGLGVWVDKTFVHINNRCISVKDMDYINNPRFYHSPLPPPLSSFERVTFESNKEISRSSSVYSSIPKKYPCNMKDTSQTPVETFILTRPSRVSFLAKGRYTPLKSGTTLVL